MVLSTTFATARSSGRGRACLPPRQRLAQTGAGHAAGSDAGVGGRCAPLRFRRRPAIRYGGGSGGRDEGFCFPGDNLHEFVRPIIGG